jgi:hypothetical protein
MDTQQLLDNESETIPQSIESVPNQCIIKKKYVCKSGEVKEYEYNQTKYSSVYYTNNKAKLSNVICCGCGGCYTTLNKSNHHKSKLHKLYVSLTQNRAI